MCHPSDLEAWLMFNVDYSEFAFKIINVSLRKQYSSLPIYKNKNNMQFFFMLFWIKLAT